jgi:hypothetical protein
MEVKLTYDPALDAWTLTHKDVHIQSPADAARWRQLLGEELQKLNGQPVFALIDVTDFDVAAVMMEDYGRTVKAIAHNFRGVFRYGAADKTRTTVLLQSIVNSFPANLFGDRAAAIEALNRARASAQGRRRRGHG